MCLITTYIPQTPAEKICWCYPNSYSSRRFGATLPSLIASMVPVAGQAFSICPLSLCSSDAGGRMAGCHKGRREREGAAAAPLCIRPCLQQHVRCIASKKWRSALLGRRLLEVMGHSLSLDVLFLSMRRALDSLHVR